MPGSGRTTKSRYEIIREVQSYCADVADRAPDSAGEWTTADGEHIARLLNHDAHPWALFRHIDERTGGSDVGYLTQDGREWFHILRQMRNTPGSGLFENLASERVTA